GAKKVDVDLKQQKVTVSGYVEPKKVLKAAQSTKKKVELWPYVPYTMVAHPYVSQAYDKKAPPNMVRKVADTSNIKETTFDDSYVEMFSDENPNACSIM
ncbi:heavy metal-associated isoprenylated plant protein 26-like, partial [Trifolium pratense]